MSDKDVLGQPLSPLVDVRGMVQEASVPCDDVLKYLRVEVRLFCDVRNRRLIMYFDGKPKAVKDENGGEVKCDRRYYYLTDEQEMQLIIALVKARSQRRGDPVSFTVGQIQNPNLQPLPPEQESEPASENMPYAIHKDGSTLCPSCNRPILRWTLRDGKRCEWCNTPVKLS